MVAVTFGENGEEEEIGEKDEEEEGQEKRWRVSWKRAVNSYILLLYSVSRDLEFKLKLQRSVELGRQMLAEKFTMFSYRLYDLGVMNMWTEIFQKNMAQVLL